jgi:signal transduction histidine kinase
VNGHSFVKIGGWFLFLPETTIRILPRTKNLMSSFRFTPIISAIIIFFGTTLSANIDSLNRVLSAHLKGKDFQSQIELYKAIGEAHLTKRNNDLAMSSFENALRIAEGQNLKKIQEDLLLKIGQTHNRLQDYPNAIKALKKLILECIPTNSLLLSNTYSAISQAYQRLGNHELAYDYELQALHQNEILNDSSKIAHSLYQIGSIFFFHRNLEVAIDYYKQSLEVCESLKLKRGIFNCLAAIGGAYSRMEDTKNSIQYNLQSYELAKEMNYQTGLAYSTHNLGVNYMAKGALKIAHDYFFQSLELKNSNQDKWGSVATLRNIGDTYRLQNKQEESFKYLTEALEISKELNSKDRRYEVYISMADHYRAFGDFEQSNTFLYKSLSLKDTLNNEATLEKMSNAKVRFEIKERETALMKKDKEIESVYKKVFTGSFLTLIVLLWLIFTRYRAQKAYNLVLEIKNQQIQAKNKELALANELQLENNIQIQEQNRKLEISNGQLQRFAFIASHDLKEPLRSIGSYSNLLKRQYQQQLDATANDFLDYIASGVTRMYQLLNDVLEYSKINTTEENLTWIDSTKLIQGVQDSLKKQIEERSAIIQIGRLPKIKINEIIAHQLFQNLISNAIKFTHKDSVPFIKISCEPKGEYLQFSVSDNGIGLDKAYENKIFEIFQRLHGKHEFEGTGVGLAICKKIVEQYNGEIWVESTLNNGSTFFFTLAVEFEQSSKQDINNSNIILLYH